MFIKFKYDLREVKLWAMTRFENECQVPIDFKKKLLREFPIKKGITINEIDLENYLQEANEKLDKFMRDLYDCVLRDHGLEDFDFEKFEKQNRSERQNLIEWRSIPFERAKKMERVGNSDLLG